MSTSTEGAIRAALDHALEHDSKVMLLGESVGRRRDCGWWGLVVGHVCWVKPPVLAKNGQAELTELSVHRRG